MVRFTVSGQRHHFSYVVLGLLVAAGLLLLACGGDRDTSAPIATATTVPSPSPTVAASDIAECPDFPKSAAYLDAPYKLLPTEAELPEPWTWATVGAESDYRPEGVESLAGLRVSGSTSFGYAQRVGLDVEISIIVGQSPCDVFKVLQLTALTAQSEDAVARTDFMADESLELFENGLPSVYWRWANVGAYVAVENSDLASSQTRASVQGLVDFLDAKVIASLPGGDSERRVALPSTMPTCVTKAAVESSPSSALLASSIVPGTTRALPSNSLNTSPGSATMQQARGRHTATLLDDGRVLVVGGNESIGDLLSGKLRQAEIYDPASGTWSPAGSTIGRTGHSATVLDDGTVMVTGGGLSLAGTLAEVFDPGSGLWSDSAYMGFPRLAHSAVTLSDGRVLVAGGYETRLRTVSKAEMYDPITDNWEATGDMNYERGSHVAVALADGRVLVIGGYSRLRPVRVPELYDPTCEVWSEAGEPVHIRAIPVAVRLADGKVLVAGGYGQDDAGDFRGLASAEVYDPSSVIWSSTGSMAASRSSHTLTLLEDGRVLAVGGFGNNTGKGRSVEVHDPATGTWSVGASLRQGRANHTATLLSDGRVLVAGGFGPVRNPQGEYPALESAEIYDPSSDTWTPSSTAKAP